MPKRRRLSYQTNIRFTRELREELERRAAARGMDVGEHIRDLVRRDLEAAQKEKEAAA